MCAENKPCADVEDQGRVIEKLTRLGITISDTAREGVRTVQPKKRSELDAQNAENLGKALDLELGEAKAKALCEDLATVVAKHHLVRSPDVCRKAFLYMVSVTEGWNS